MVNLYLENLLASQYDIMQLEELGTMSLDDSVWPVKQASIKYQLQLSTLCSNENRTAMIIYYRMT